MHKPRKRKVNSPQPKPKHNKAEYKTLKIRKPPVSIPKPLLPLIPPDADPDLKAFLKTPDPKPPVPLEQVYGAWYSSKGDHKA